jgi:hypothetical protein
MYSLDNRHSLALPYWARPGLRFIGAPSGGGRERDDEGGDDDEGDDDDEELDEDPDEELDEAGLRAALKEQRAAAQKAMDRAKKSTVGGRKLKGELARLNDELAKVRPAKVKAGDDDDEKLTNADLEAARKRGLTEGTTAAETKAIKAAARSYLKGAGVAVEDVNDVVRLLDFDDLDLDDDGEVDGLDEAIADLRTRRPEFFGKRRKAPVRRISGDASDIRKPKNDDRTVSQMQADKILGR